MKNEHDSPPVAFITGITGQDGSYLAELLLRKGYRVVGLVSAANNPMGMGNISQIIDRVELVEGDLTDKDAVHASLRHYKPTEIYNLAGITFIPQAWEDPAAAFQINTIGVTHILTYLASSLPTTKFLQASSAKIFGATSEIPQTESTPLAPTDPYGTSKAAAQMLVDQFRAKHNLFVSCAILYNHESERRGPEFVTRKITLAAARIKYGLQNSLDLGNLDAAQDWGYAPDYIEGMWRILQARQSENFILASGTTHTVREFVELAFQRVGLPWQDHVTTNPRLVRPPSPQQSIGNPAKAKAILGWEPKITFHELVNRMIDADLARVRQELGRPLK